MCGVYADFTHNDCYNTRSTGWVTYHKLVRLYIKKELLDIADIYLYFNCLHQYWDWVPPTKHQCIKWNRFFSFGETSCVQGFLVVGICGIGILSRDCIHLNLLHLVLVRSKLYQYGLDAGDKASDKKDDACTNVYTQNITMYGMNFDKIYVSDQCSPCSFPHVSQSQYKCRFQRHCSTMKQSECLSQMLEVFHHLPTL